MPNPPQIHNENLDIPLKDELYKEIIELTTKHHFSVVSSVYSRAFGDSLLELSRGDLHVRFIRDRSQRFTEVKLHDEVGWHNLLDVLEAIDHRSHDEEFDREWPHQVSILLDNRGRIESLLKEIELSKWSAQSGPM